MPHPVERSRIETALQGLPVDVWRAKGFLRLRGEDGLMLLQYSGGSAGGGIWQFAPFRLYADMKEPPASLVFIGPALERDKILRDFGGHTLLAVL